MRSEEKKMATIYDSWPGIGRGPKRTYFEGAACARTGPWKVGRTGPEDSGFSCHPHPDICLSEITVF
jgi:hypothetical protein